MHVTVTEAKAHLSSLIARACAGESIIIERMGTPMVVLTPVEGMLRPKTRTPGALKGKIQMSDDFDAWDASMAKLFTAPLLPPEA
ncbi:MAG: type II toxin-antitoxin system Phd/YefM family antitoxin [Holosporales bacterium]|jgi:prevent-host-death family protein